MMTEALWLGDLPFESAIFLLVPQLPRIDEVLPNHIRAWSYGCNRVEKSDGEPDAHNGIFLSQSLSGADTIAITITHSFADGEQQDADGKW